MITITKLRTGYLVHPVKYTGAAPDEQHAFATLADALAHIKNQFEPDNKRAPKETK